ncbi:hypothetical protein GOP47_0007159 [Adiantum capillus-veneris]|uniref:Uncharacterized protein n=1 Tax=Adiantum capillus-veneris TaxID=13818 RepID=A0A9D4ZLM4_ADICA|nr:hypothetical protein GOP47_0007159 [Adiantum capillus-veneris]
MEMVSRAIPLQTLKAAIQELFDLYLGSSRNSKHEDVGKDLVVFPAQKRIVAANKSRAPNNDQFTLDFKILQSQFPDQEQLRIVVEPMLATLLASCSAHMVQVEFLLSAVQALSNLKFLNWDSFLILLLKAAAALESSGQVKSSIQSGPGSTQSGPNSVIGVSNVPVQHPGGMLQVSTPAPPASPASALLGSPSYTGVDPSVSQSPAKVSDPSSTGLSSRAAPVQRTYKVAAWLRQVVCKVILLGSEAGDLHPLTCLEVLSQVVQWINSWDAGDTVVNAEEKLHKSFQNQHEEKEWLYGCLKMLDQHLQCPTFATARMTAFSYQGAMGEPLYGEADPSISSRRRLILCCKDVCASFLQFVS